MELHLDVDAEEWALAADLVRFTTGDERGNLGMVHLACDGRVRRWTGTDLGWLASQTTIADARIYEVLLSPRIIYFGHVASDAGEDVELVVGHDDDGRVTTVRASSDSDSLVVAGDRSQFPPVQDMVEEAAIRPGSSIELEAVALRRVMRSAATRAVPDADADAPTPLFWVSIDEGGLEVDLSWAGLGQTSYRVSGAGTGNVRRAFPPLQVSDAVMDWKGPVTFKVPEDPREPLCIVDAERTVLIMPVDTTHERMRGHVEDVIVEVFGPEVIHRDLDGDYLLAVTGVPVYARLLDGRPPMVQVFACILDGVEPSPELLGELNEHNAAIGFARLFWVAGQVLAESDMVASSLDPEELDTAFQRVVDVAQGLAPMLHAMFGGRTVERSDDERWELRQGIIVEAETSPGVWVPLTGPDAVEEWPYPGVIHVLSAADPGGRQRPDLVNERATIELGREVLAAGGGLARVSFGHSVIERETPGRGHLAWDLNRGSAAGIGSAFGQDVILELDADEMRIVECDGPRIDVVPRVAHQSAEAE